MTLLLIGLGAAVGAPARYLTDRAIGRRLGGAFPFGTLCVNLVASFVLGLLVGLDASARMTALVGTGFCGALSTWSTLGYETFRLAEDREHRLAVANLALSLVAGLGAAVLGWAVGAAL